MSDDLRPQVAPMDVGAPPGAGADYAAMLGASLQRAHYNLALRWLERLVALLPVEPGAVFSSHLLLDHIPSLIEEIGRYVAAPDDEDIAARTIVVDKARELGQLRHQQQASLHQVLREYDLLGEILEQFVIDETRVFQRGLTAADSLEINRRVNRAVRVLMQITASTFIAQYTETITEQAARLDRFNRGVSHELRNVLGALNFGSELLQDEHVTSDEVKRRHIIASVRRNSQRAIKIIRSFERLPRSHIVADSPVEQVVDVGETTQEALRQLQDMAAARGVALHASGPFPTLYLDSGALELTLINLVSNAIKYSDPGKTKKFVNVSAQAGDDSLTLRVEDNGLGIPADAVDKVFERFARAHAELDEKLGVDGTGLGLSIVEECVRALNGQISVASTEGAGTTFTIVIPKKLPPLREGE